MDLFWLNSRSRSFTQELRDGDESMYDYSGSVIVFSKIRILSRIYKKSRIEITNGTECANPQQNQPMYRFGIL